MEVLTQANLHIYFDSKQEMKVCSISRRKDYAPDVKSVEVAIGTDRCVHNFLKKRSLREYMNYQVRINGRDDNPEYDGESLEKAIFVAIKSVSRIHSDVTIRDEKGSLAFIKFDRDKSDQSGLDTVQIEILKSLS